MIVAELASGLLVLDSLRESWIELGQLLRKADRKNSVVEMALCMD